jgi:hypothetical protein
MIAHHESMFELTIDMPSAHPSTGSLFSVGFEHFRAGPDHLLFLGLVALGAARCSPRLSVTARRLAVLTITFTIGHSLSLALASVGWVGLSGPLVETAIAVTILLAAVHAVKRVVPAGAELAITLLFGFIHGFGFAGTLEDLSLSGVDLVVPLLTFNLGLEAAQLLALAIVAWQVCIIARSRVARVALSATVGLIAISWIIERGLGVSNPLDGLIGVLLASPERLAVVLMGVAAAAMSATAVRQPNSADHYHAELLNSTGAVGVAEPVAASMVMPRAAAAPGRPITR